MINTKGSVKAEGFLLIRDRDTREILVDTHNDINMGNFSQAIAMSLSREDGGVIEEMHFGNGGTEVNSTGELTYKEPQVTLIVEDLHNPTYFKNINDKSANFDGNADDTNIKSLPHIQGDNYTDIQIVCTLGYGEPADAALYDDATYQSGTQDPKVRGKYIFDEIGLKTPNGRLLTHVIFHPVQKAQNRAIEITYTIRITMV